MALAGIAFLVGVLLAQSLSRLPGDGVLIVIAIVSMALLGIGRLRIAALLLLGFSWTLIYAQARLDQQLPSALEGKSIAVVGHIASLPEHNAKRARFLFDIDTIAVGAETIAQTLRVRLNWYGASAPPRVGERWRLVVRLKRPHGFSNPGGFDYETWLFQQGIRATGYVVRRAEHQRLQSGTRRYFSGQLRQYIAAKIDVGTAGLNHRASLRALSIGDRSNIDRDAWQRLTDTGTNHLFAISGLHIGLVAVLAYALAGGIWRCFPPLYRRLDRARFACFCALLPAGLYAMLAGLALPTQRALIMLLVPAAALLWRRRLPPLTGIGMALLSVLAFDPLSTLSPGFWLSFGAVAVIISQVAGRLAPATRWHKLIGMQLAIAIGLSPLLIAQFGALPSASAIANLFAVPWVSLVVVPLTLLGVLCSLVSDVLASWLFQLADASIGVFWLLLRWIESSGYLPVVSLHAPAWVVVFIGLATLLLLVPRGSGLRPLALLLLLPLLAPAKDAIAPGDLRVVVLDVGQGLAVLVQTARKNLVYDAGGRFSANFNAGDAVLLPALKSLGVQRVDTLMISHADLDHRGGLHALLEHLPVGLVLSSDPGAIATPSTPCLRGQQWQWDGIHFDVLHPGESSGASSRNNRSCVLRISAGDASLLLPGDIERPAERMLLSRGPVRADILVAPHHGSSTSSSPAFVDAVAPRHVVYAVGYRNRFGFPKAEVEQRYALAGATTWRTDRDGAVVFEWSHRTQRWSVHAHRDTSHRFWRGKAIRPTGSGSV